MDDKRLLQALYEYKRLEDRFIELTQYIPLVADLEAPNYNFPSPQAANFGLDCCTWLETLMTELLNDERVDDIPQIEKLRADPKISAYRKAFVEKFGFGKGGWGLKDLGGNEVWPFESWESGKNPEWFQIYSKYKHHRFDLVERWTMKHALESFVALTMILQHWEKPAKWERRESKVLEGVIY